MSFTLDANTNVGKVRYLINDTDAVNFILTDEAITSFISIRGGDLFLSAAQCMLSIASSQALLAKFKEAGDYKEDLRQVSKECREAAQVFMQMAEETPAEAQAGVFWTDFSYREELRNRAVRGELS